MGLDKDSIEGKLVFQEFQPKNWEETDVDIKITHCGICASDTHTLCSGWNETTYPICVGHEIVGTIVRVGSKVEKGLKLGDRVGVGAQSGSCLKCGQCHTDNGNYCDDNVVGTYNGQYPDGSRSQGGYGDYARVPSHYVVKIPEGLSSDVAAPMMCGGITVYSPLKDNGAGTTAKRVGIVGIGGLGHFGLMFAKALGAEVTAISHSDHKKADAMALGATHFIATGKEGWETENRRSLDLIVSTTNDSKMPIAKYLELLAPKGRLILVGLPEGDETPQIPIWSLVTGGRYIGGSMVGDPKQIEEMLELAAKQDLKTWIEPYPMEKVNEAIVKLTTKGMRYRAVLYNHKHINN